MPIIVNCRCGKKLRVADGSAGKRAKCPACGHPFTVPLPQDSTAPSTAADDHSPVAPVARVAAVQPDRQATVPPVEEAHQADQAERQAAFAALLAALDQYRKPVGWINGSLGCLAMLSIVAGIVLWITTGFWIGLGVALGCIVLFVIAAIVLQAPHNRRAKTDVEFVEARFNLSREEAFELLHSDKEAVAFGEFKEFAVAAWGEAVRVKITPPTPAPVAEKPETTEFVCPKCAATDVQLIKGSGWAKRTATSVVGGIVGSALFGSFGGMIGSGLGQQDVDRYRCKSCQHEWAKS